MSPVDVFIYMTLFEAGVNLGGAVSGCAWRPAVNGFLMDLNGACRLLLTNAVCFTSYLGLLRRNQVVPELGLCCNYSESFSC